MCREDGDRAALEGVDTLLLIPGHVIATRVAAHQSAIDAAVRAGVRKVVYVSFVRAAADATFTFSRQHFATEEAVRASGLGWTIARMNFFLDEFPLLPADVIDPHQLLYWNRQAPLVCFAQNKAREVFVCGELPLESLEVETLDRFLGLLLASATRAREFAIQNG